MDTDGGESDGDDDEFLDVLDVLDGRGDPDFGDESDGDIRGGKDPENESGGDEDEEEEDGDEEEDEEEDGEMNRAFAPSDAEQQSDEEALDNLDAFVSKLEPGKKRKAEDEPSDAAVSAGVAPKPKRRMLKERTEAGVENEFGVSHVASGGWAFSLYLHTERKKLFTVFTLGSKLGLDDFLAPLESTSYVQALRNAAKVLTNGDALPTPLPLRTQDRLDREAAYEQTKAEVDKWKATMKRIKEVNSITLPLFGKTQSCVPGRSPQLSPSSTKQNTSV